MTNSYSQPLDAYNYHVLKERSVALLEKQELRLEATFNNLSLGDTGQSFMALTINARLKVADNKGCSRQQAKIV